MNRQELIKKIAEEANITNKAAGNALSAFINAVSETLKTKKDKVSLIGFGTFQVSERAERKGRNPKTKKEMIIPKHSVPVFKASKKLKELVGAAAKPAPKAKKK